MPILLEEKYSSLEFTVLQVDPAAVVNLIVSINTPHSTSLKNGNLP